CWSPPPCTAPWTEPHARSPPGCSTSTATNQPRPWAWPVRTAYGSSEPGQGRLVTAPHPAAAAVGQPGPRPAASVTASSLAPIAAGGLPFSLSVIVKKRSIDNTITRGDRARAGARRDTRGAFGDAGPERHTMAQLVETDQPNGPETLRLAHFARDRTATSK